MTATGHVPFDRAGPYRYHCDGCGIDFIAALRVERMPGVLPHPDGGTIHYRDGTTDWCGPLRRIEEPTCES